MICGDWHSDRDGPNTMAIQYGDSISRLYDETLTSISMLYGNPISLLYGMQYPNYMAFNICRGRTVGNTCGELESTYQQTLLKSKISGCVSPNTVNIGHEPVKWREKKRRSRSKSRSSLIRQETVTWSV